MSSLTPLVTTLVQAGAGTGKTESLAGRILEVAIALYEKNQRVPRIVATTFTERATAELRERVVSILSKRKDSPVWLADFVQNTERLQISTIHGALSSLLHRFATHLDIDPEFEVISETEERNLLGNISRAVLSENQEMGELLNQYSFKELIQLIQELFGHYRLHRENFNPTDQWREVVTIQTKSLLEALAHLASFDVSESVSGSSAKGPSKSFEKVKLIQSLNATLRSKAGDYKELRASFLEITGEMVKPSIRAGAKGAEFKPFLDTIFEIRDHWVKETYSPEINERAELVHTQLKKLIVEVGERVQAQKVERGVLTFNDLEFLSLELVRRSPEALTAIRQDFDFWFVDEFQDTSPLQKELLTQFFRKPWNAYFVGDPQQSIYLFRGADQNVFKQTRNQVEAQSGCLERLAVNYRSEPDLLKFMNELFGSLEMRPGQEAIGVLEPKGPYEGKQLAQIQLVNQNQVKELDVIAFQVQRWLADGFDFHDIAILVTTNDKAKEVAAHLNSLKIPVYMHSSGGYFERREVLDALGFLSFLENPSDDEVFILICRTPWLGIPDTVLAQWGRARKKKTYWEYLDEIKAFDSFHTLAILRVGVERAETTPLSLVFFELLEQLGLLAFSLVGDVSGRREANLRKLHWQLSQAEQNAGFSASHFIDTLWQETLDDGGVENEASSFVEPKRVNVLTIHKSKGLKFNCVIVPFCNDSYRVKGQPLERAPDGRWAARVLSLESEEKVAPIMHEILRDERSQRELGEYTRVFYVALTRAAKRVCLVASRGETGPSAKSWLGQIRLDLSEGDHSAGYQVGIFDEPLNIEALQEKKDEMRNEKVCFPETQHKFGERFTVTEMVRGLGEAAEGEALANRASVKLLYDQLESQQRGQAVHFIFEELKKNLNQDLNTLCEIARRRFGVRWAIEPSLVSKTLELNKPPLKKLIETGQVEWPFEFLIDDLALNSSVEGQVDLWGQVDDETWIIDYKSSRHVTSKAIERARRQLELYALAVHKTGIAWRDIQLAIVAPLEGQSHLISLRPKEEIIAELQSLLDSKLGQISI